MSRVICRCSECAQETFTTEDGTFSGQQVAPATRIKHEERDRNRRPSIPAASSARKPEPKPLAQQPDFTQDGDTIVRVCIIVLLWLRLCARLSRTNIRKLSAALSLIISLILSVLAVALSYAKLRIDLPDIQLPVDERTMLQRLKLEPEIVRNVHCPRCFAPYPAAQVPETCTHKETQYSRVCKERLKRSRQTKHGHVLIPRCLYSVQAFDSWLRFFLSRQTIDSQLYGSFHMPPADGVMRGIWDSPAWNSLGHYHRQKYNLVFTLYLDWFNPFGNKISGKVVSVGAIILACLNLPPELRFLIENLFFASLMPPPFQADFVTLSYLLNPIINQLESLFRGVRIPTASHPEGVEIHVQILPIIADLGAIRKLCGFVSASAELLCTYCHTTHGNIEDLDFAAWTPRTADDVRTAAHAWRDANLVRQRNEITKRTGVRWSPLHRLEYWDPVKSLVPGFMHNMVEGILTRHLRIRWGLGAPDAAVKSYVQDLAEENETFDSSDYDTELEELAKESLESGDTGPAQERRSHSVEIAQLLHDAAGDDDAEDGDYVMDDNSTITQDSDFQDLGVPELMVFSKDEITQIRHCIQNIVLPSWVSRPPHNLGEASHGKLKADVVLLLFTVILPTILPEIWTAKSEPRFQVLLKNFGYLVASANIVASFTTSPAKADEYMQHFVEYRRTCRQLWPNIQSVPNEHIAMHNGEALKFWGPLPPLSEFPYERQNGILASIPTNNHLYDMDLTMLRQICRRGRLEALIRDSASQTGSALIQALCHILFPPVHSSVSSISQSDAALFNATASMLSEDQYNLILAHVNKNHPIWRHRNAMPHPSSSSVLSPMAKSSARIEHDGRPYSISESHLGNSSIQFYEPGSAKSVEHSGFIKKIWTLIMGNKLHTFMLVQLHGNISPIDLAKSPYPGLAPMSTHILSAQSGQEQMVIEPPDIICHVAFYTRPKGTFGMSEEIHVANVALNRGRK